MKFHRPSRLRLVFFPLIIIAAAVAGTLAFGAASSAASHPPAMSRSPLAGAISSTLHSQGLEISKPAARIGPHISRQAAVAMARAQPIAPFKGVQQVALAHVTFYRMRPAVSGLFWVVSLKPSGNVPSNGMAGKHHPPVKVKYYVIVINAVTGHFYWASIGG
jgi:hypothetical protein